MFLLFLICFLLLLSAVIIRTLLVYFLILCHSMRTQRYELVPDDPIMSGLSSICLSLIYLSFSYGGFKYTNLNLHRICALHSTLIVILPLPSFSSHLLVLEVFQDLIWVLHLYLMLFLQVSRRRHIHVCWVHIILSSQHFSNII